MPDQHDRNRRGFLKTALAGATVLPVAGLGVSLARPALAQEARAQDGHALDYVNDASDAAGHALYEPGQRCDNCIFWSGEVADGWGGCMHPDFEDVLVKDEGWCSAYILRE